MGYSEIIHEQKNPIFERANDMNWHFSKEEIQIAK
jgi:hypothetical protein